MRTRQHPTSARPTGWLGAVVVAALVAALVAACGTSTPTHRAEVDGTSDSSPAPAATVTVPATIAGASTSPATANPRVSKPPAKPPTKRATRPPKTRPQTTKPQTTTPPTTTPPTTTPPTITPPTSVRNRPGTTALPLGGTRIFPRLRVVADYGAAGNSGLGVLGAGTPEQAAVAIEHRAAAYKGYGKPVQPAMELLATVAQGSAGADGDYSKAVSPAAVEQYLAVAKRHHMLLVLDFQPGRGDFLPQVKQFRRFLDDPWVGVGLDPEWKIGPGQIPGTVIGSSSAASINAVSSYLAGIVRTEHLPQKLFVVHQFTLSMLPDREHIAVHPELATVLHADGHGNREVKTAVYHQLRFPLPFATGFKLFVSQDGHVMTPAQVMALDRRPDLVTYE